MYWVTYSRHLNTANTSDRLAENNENWFYVLFYFVFAVYTYVRVLTRSFALLCYPIKYKKSIWLLLSDIQYAAFHYIKLHNTTLHLTILHYVMLNHFFTNPQTTYSVLSFTLIELQLQVMPSEYDEFVLYLEGRRSMEAFLIDEECS